MSPTDNYIAQVEAMQEVGIAHVVRMKDFVDFAKQFIPREYDISEEFGYTINALNDVVSRCITDKFCPHCRINLFMSDLPEYDYVCPICDENFYECEIIKEVE